MQICTPIAITEQHSPLRTVIAPYYQAPDVRMPPLRGLAGVVQMWKTMRAGGHVACFPALHRRLELKVDVARQAGSGVHDEGSGEFSCQDSNILNQDEFVIRPREKRKQTLGKGRKNHRGGGKHVEELKTPCTWLRAYEMGWWK